MFFLASSKLLPQTATHGFLQSPFQLASSDQKPHSTGMLAVTCRFTTSDVIITPVESELFKFWPLRYRLSFGKSRQGYLDSRRKRAGNGDDLFLYKVPEFLAKFQ